MVVPLLTIIFRRNPPCTSSSDWEVACRSLSKPSLVRRLPWKLRAPTPSTMWRPRSRTRKASPWPTTFDLCWKAVRRWSSRRVHSRWGGRGSQWDLLWTFRFHFRLLGFRSVDLRDVSLTKCLMSVCFLQALQMWNVVRPWCLNGSMSSMQGLVGYVSSLFSHSIFCRNFTLTING